MRVLFVDTETGGFKKPLTPVEVGGLYVDSIVIKHAEGNEHDSFLELYEPSQPMEFGAMSVHHILPQDVLGRRSWDKDKFALRLQGVSFLIGHNVDFDDEVLGFTGIRKIDTLALSRYWAPDLDSHKLGAMMYYLFGANDITRRKLKEAHSAQADVIFCRDVCLELVRRFGPNLHNWEELYAISEEGRIPYRFTFGKYGPKDGKQGMRIADFMNLTKTSREHSGYLSWMRREMGDDVYLMKALRKHA